jgi:hypothetical protein
MDEKPSVGLKVMVGTGSCAMTEDTGIKDKANVRITRTVVNHLIIFIIPPGSS